MFTRRGDYRDGRHFNWLRLLHDCRNGQRPLLLLEGRFFLLFRPPFIWFTSKQMQARMALACCGNFRNAGSGLELSISKRDIAYADSSDTFLNV
jgi:hypothetical protein